MTPRVLTGCYINCRRFFFFLFFRRQFFPPQTQADSSKATSLYMAFPPSLTHTQRERERDEITLFLCWFFFCWGSSRDLGPRCDGGKYAFILHFLFTFMRFSFVIMVGNVNFPVTSFFPLFRQVEILLTPPMASWDTVPPSFFDLHLLHSEMHSSGRVLLHPSSLCWF